MVNLIVKERSTNWPSVSNQSSSIVKEEYNPLELASCHDRRRGHNKYNIMMSCKHNSLTFKKNDNNNLNLS